MLDQLAGAAGLLFDVDLLGTYAWRLLHGLRITVEVVVISCSLGFVLAYPLARARMSRNRMEGIAKKHHRPAEVSNGRISPPP
jgi:hypothetical protein